MRINLLPPEVGERQRTRRRTVATIAVGVVVLLVIGVVYFFQVLRLRQVEEDVGAQEARNAELRTQIAGLQDVTSLEAEIDETRNLVASLLADRILWSGILRDISLVIPGELWLNGLSAQSGAATAPVDGTTTAPAEGTAAQPTGALVGQISFTGFAFEHRDVALWLSRLEDVRGFINPWLSTSAKTEIGNTEVVSFTSSVDLSEQALARANGERP